MGRRNPDPLHIKRPGHGGKREGAGRPPSSATKRSQEVANQIAEGKRLLLEEEGDLPPDATPLDVMLMAMRAAFKLGGSLMAAPYAEKAAPYLHAKISSIELKSPTDEGNKGDNKPARLLVEFVKAKAQE